MKNCLKALFQSSDKPFYASILIMLCSIWYAGYDIGVNSDEMDMCVYGKANIRYYQTHGKDTSYLRPPLPDGSYVQEIIRYYGPAFEYIAAGVNAVTHNGNQYEYNKRHLLNQFMGILAILFSGLLARHIAGRRAALWTIWLLFLSPRFFGLALFDTKDIPFTTGYIASVYFMILYISGKVKQEWQVMTGLILALAFTIGQRIAGIILLPYLFLFSAGYWMLQHKDQSPVTFLREKRILLKLVFISAITMGIVVLSWPYLLQAPVKHLKEAMQTMQKFPQKIPIIYAGEYIDSLDVPKTYLLRYMVLTIPAVILLLIPFSIAWTGIYQRKNGIAVWCLYVLFSSLFPILFTVSQRTVLYNGWRHLTFVYPGLIVIAGTGLSLFQASLAKPITRGLLTGAILLLLLPATWWNIRNNPYGYSYYNELAGGLKEAYYNYESDCWQISVKDGIDWLMKHEKLAQSKDTILFGSNAYSFSWYYIKKRYPRAKIKVNRTSYKSRFTLPWNYGVFSNLFLSPAYLERNFPPAQHSIHTVSCDGMPFSVVLKDTLRLEYAATQYAMKNNYEQANKLFDQFLTNEHYDPLRSPTDYGSLYSMIAFTKAVHDQFKEAMIYGTKAVAENDSDYPAHLALGMAFTAAHDNKQALYHFKIAHELNQADEIASAYIKYLEQKGS